jgi:uncharacterized membrane protein
MVLLVLGLALWFAAHGLKIHAPARRAALVAQYGEMPVKGAMALLLIVSVVLMVKGYQGADFVNLWFPPAWTVHLNNLLMLVALGVYTAAPFKGHVRHWIRHPQLAGVKIWALAHLLVNGDLASVVLFGGLLGWAVLAMIGINRRDGKGPKPAPGTMLGNLLHAGVTVVLLVAIGWVHNWLGVWPFPGTAPA